MARLSTRRPGARSCALLALAALLPACTDYGLGLPDAQNDPGVPAIDVTPRALDFLSGQAGDVTTRRFTIANVGDALVELEPLALGGDAGFSLLTTDLPSELAPGDWVDVDVAWTPIAPGRVEGTVTVDSSDADEPSIPVALTAEGLIGSLQISPDDWDFGEVAVACEQDVELTLQNVGRADLTLTALSYDGDVGLTLIDEPALPLVLAPGAYTTATVRFVPADVVDASGLLTAVSDDPAGDRTAVQQGAGVGTAPRSETFPVDTDPPLDLIVAVDRSSSMLDDAVSLGAGFTAFAAALSANTSDWRMGVVTQDDGCFNGGVLSPLDADVAAAFALAVVTGEDAEIVYDEALLKLSSEALGQTDSGGCNAGFLREDAPLHVIVVSDEPERSYQEAAAWTWDFWLERMQGALDRPDALVVSGVVDKSDCNEGDAGYAEAIAATGGAHLDLCSDDWGSHLAALAEVSASWLWTYPLAEPAQDGTIEVLVDGEAVDGWSWDADANAVVFDDRPPGDEVEVRYQGQGECP